MAGKERIGSGKGNIEYVNRFFFLGKTDRETKDIDAKKKTKREDTKQSSAKLLKQNEISNVDKKKYLQHTPSKSTVP